MRRVFLLAILFLVLAVRSLGEEPAKPSDEKPVAEQSHPSSQPTPSCPEPADSSTAMKAKVDAEIQKRVKELIELINQEPNVLMVNPKAVVVKDENWRPYTPDGKYNQDFKVIPDDSSPEVSQALKIEQNRQKWTNELVMIGLPAVPELIKASLDTGRKYRYFYITALGLIKDVKATPAILKYYQEGIDQEKLAKSMEKMAAVEDAEALRKEAIFRKGVAIEALKNISGKDFGDDYAKWEQWWKDMEKKIGPVELPKLYEIKGTNEKPSTQFVPATVSPAGGSTAK